MKIQAWENHQKAKTEAKMKKIEVYTYHYSLCCFEYGSL